MSDPPLSEEECVTRLRSQRDDESWPRVIYNTLRDAGVAQVAYVPDTGHSDLITMVHADPNIHATVLTTEEEGVAIASGAWLGGQRAVLLMQSSGIGNCINTLSLVTNCRFPLLALVTMRGEWAEFNPWQIPMGRATQPVLELMGVNTHKIEHPDDVEETISSAITLAFEAEQAIAVLLSQRMLGRKVW